MKRTTALNSVGGLHVDRNPGASTPGTAGVAEDRNNLQEEICHLIEGAGFTLDGADQYQLEKASIASGKEVGEIFDLMLNRTPIPYASARSTAHPSYPRYFPAIPRWDADRDILSTSAPDLVTALRAEKAMYKGVTDFSVTVSGSTVTFSGASGIALVLSVLNDAKCSNWFNLGQTAASPAAGDFATASTLRCINIAGTDYPIVGAVPGTPALAVTGTPPSGTQTAILYPYRVAGYTDRIRLHRIAGMVKVAGGDADGEYGAGMRVMDAGQGHRHVSLHTNFATGTVLGNSSASSNNQGTYSDPTTGDSTTDGTNGTPRTGKNTNPRAHSTYTYTWAARLLTWS